VERLKADGAASAFVNMASRASRAETDRNNLRADLDAIKAILTDEKARAERAEVELAAERARLDWLMAGGVCMMQAPGGFYISRLHAHVSRAAIDAAMKESA
jgi:hypothetical protein